MANKIGYRKPPAHSRFKKGQSGNPRGRTKGSRNLATDLREELDQKILITEGGKSKRLTKQQVAIKSLMRKAMKGDARAISVIIDLSLKMWGFPIEAGPETPLSEEDAATLKNLKERLRAEALARVKDDSSDPERDHPMFK